MSDLDQFDGRGLRRAPPVPAATMYGGTLGVRESPNTDEPRVWVIAADGIDGRTVAVELNIDGALELAEGLARVCRLHRQREPR